MRAAVQYFELNGNAVVSAGNANLDNFINLSGYHDGDTAQFNMSGLVDNITYN